MASSDKLRKTRKNIVINTESKVMDKNIDVAVSNTLSYLTSKYKYNFISKKQIYIKEIVDMLNDKIEEGTTNFSYHHNSSFIRPDGGCIFLIDKKGNKYPILISEIKKQGTNNKLVKEGKDKQSKGNAIERLGKNVCAFRAMLTEEDIFPFICFGSGCDFEPSSTILDRVSCIAMFGELNKVNVHNNGRFQHGSYFFREEDWTLKEIEDLFKVIVDESIRYYTGKYGDIF